MIFSIIPQGLDLDHAHASVSVSEFNSFKAEMEKMKQSLSQEIQTAKSEREEMKILLHQQIRKSEEEGEEMKLSLSRKIDEAREEKEEMRLALSEEIEKAREEREQMQLTMSHEIELMRRTRERMEEVVKFFTEQLAVVSADVAATKENVEEMLSDGTSNKEQITTTKLPIDETVTIMKRADDKLLKTISGMDSRIRMLGMYHTSFRKEIANNKQRLEVIESAVREAEEDVEYVTDIAIQLKNSLQRISEQSVTREGFHSLKNEVQFLKEDISEIARYDKNQWHIGRLGRADIRPFHG